MRSFNVIYILALLTLLPRHSVAQAAMPENDSAAITTKTIAAGPAYERGSFHTWLWGKNRRAEWTTPIQVPILYLDTAFGGLKPYKAGGGNETRSLRLKSVDGKEYTLRSVNKSRSDVVPKEFKNTFVDDIVRDQVSMAHPYAALALPVMQEKAGIYYSRSMVVWVPEQAALDSFNDKFKNDLYLLEQRPDGDWSEADNLGNFEKYESTADVIEKMMESNKNSADQYRFMKARLFDMLISDWDRHEDNWRWGVSKDDGEKRYIPVPRDRDQPFYSHDGLLNSFLLSAAKLKYMQHFDHKIKNIEDLNWEMRYIDRFFTNALTGDDWQRAATELQQALTDDVIEQSIRQLPPAIYNVSGQELIDKLKSRRKQLPEFAKQYYLFLSPEVFVPGTKENEYFEVKETDGGNTEVAIYRISDKGETESQPYYRRVFNPSETKQIRLFGIDGHDEFNVKNNSKAIKIQVSDTMPSYKYKWYEYNYKGFGPDISYNNPDRLFVGIRYKNTKQRWDKKPFASQHILGVRYSISQNAISAYAKALYPEAIGKWDLDIYGEYDAIRWTNFYGTGNETQMLTKDVQFHRLRSREWFASLGLTRNFGKSRLNVSGFYQNVMNIDDTGRYVAKIFHTANADVYEENPYAGAAVTYAVSTLTDSIVPVKGFAFQTTGTLSNNFRQNEFFQKYEADLRAFFPITKHISFALRAGAATVVNDAVLNSGQQYQHAIIGGGRSLRGYRRERFWGQSAYYNQNELRFITDFRSRIMNGKIGVFGFFDNGRVWMPGEESNKIHIGYGPGLLLAPFNKISATITYSFSEEIRIIQVRIDSKLFTK
jgi:hypothetical protein